MAHHFILLWLSLFELRVDREGWWFEHSVSWLQVCLSAVGAKNVSWSWLSSLQGWGSLTMAFTGKFVCIYIERERERETYYIYRLWFFKMLFWIYQTILMYKQSNFSRNCRKIIIMMSKEIIL